MRYSLTFDDVATGTVADTFTTFAAIIVADTAGHRCRLRSLCIGPSDDAPADLNVGIKLARIADVSGGSAGTGTAVTTANMGKIDPGTPASLMSGKRDFTAEPTAYETEPLFAMGMNARGGLIKEWSEDGAPVVTQDQLLGLLACPRTTTAVKLSGSLEFEIY